MNTTQQHLEDRANVLREHLYTVAERFRTLATMVDKDPIAFVRNGGAHALREAGQEGCDAALRLEELFKVLDFVEESFSRSSMSMSGTERD